MRAKLSLKNGRTDYLFTRQATIGTESTCTIVISGEEVGPVHVRIAFDEKAGGFQLEPREGYTTLLEGKPVQQPTLLRDTNEITLGTSVAMIFQLQTDSEFSGKKRRSHSMSADAPTVLVGPNEQPARNHVADPDATVIDYLRPVVVTGSNDSRGNASHVIKADRSLHQAIFLQVTEGASQQVYKLVEGDNVVGRSRECAVCLDDRSISRKHAVMKLTNGKILIKDLGSKNHTFVNHERIVGEIELPSDSNVRFGLVEARVIRTMYSESTIDSP